MLPADLLPRDGRFGSGPSKVPADAVAQMAASAPLGTSHRQPPVRDLVGRIRIGLRELLALPEGYEIVLGNGGSTAFWDAAAFGLIRHRAQHVVCGEFSAKFAAVTAGAPFLADPDVRRFTAGTGGLPAAMEDGGNAADPDDGNSPGVAAVDVYAWPQNETSTGVMLPVQRVEAADALMLVDATSAAGAIATDLAQADVYYFAPQKVFAAEGGLWLAAFSPAALERVAELAGTGRWVPPSLDLTLAISNSAQNQTYNTPAIASLWLMAERTEWLLAQGGAAWAAARSAESSAALYAWAEASEFASPFVRDAAWRSPVVGTIDFSDRIDAAAIARTLRGNGVVDTEPYRGLGRNQLRIGMYPAVDPDDVRALTACIDHVVTRL